MIRWRRARTSPSTDTNTTERYWEDVFLEASLPRSKKKTSRRIRFPPWRIPTQRKTRRGEGCFQKSQTINPPQSSPMPALAIRYGIETGPRRKVSNSHAAAAANNNGDHLTMNLVCRLIITVFIYDPIDVEGLTGRGVHIQLSVQTIKLRKRPSALRSNELCAAPVKVPSLSLIEPANHLCVPLNKAFVAGVISCQLLGTIQQNLTFVAKELEREKIVVIIVVPNVRVIR